MAWSQRPVSASEARERDDVADLHVGSVDHDAVDEQLHERPALVEGRPLEAGGEGGAERLDPAGQVAHLRFAHGLGRGPLLLSSELGQALLEGTPRVRPEGGDVAERLERCGAEAAPGVRV
jgi:hypothetical protein